MREYLGYMSTLDRLTYVILELMSVPMKFRGRISKSFTKLGYTCRVIKTWDIRIDLKKRLCGGLTYVIEFNIFVSLLLNRNLTCYTEVQVVNTFVYAQS